MNETTNYKLKKPETNEYVSIEVINENMDTLDKEMKAVSQSVDKAIKQRNISLSADGWSDEYPYTQTVEAEDITADDNLKVVGLYIPDGATVDQVKAWNKAAACLMSNMAGVTDGAVTFAAYKKPEADFIVVVEGG